ncbi:histidine phosphatase family protein [Methylorubrum extorquens]|uniref:histidine phosphatase family protein n=1 Tax=Methylorubrum extorquens TaxID=408 RepID=UPI000158FBB5|nr:histidine phosphatase family protein [Methylorubrum extorquens]ABY28918.1 Phosphoglycerate mutase [Methylorubrum extorquens PA1]KQP94507.1 phosphoglycerate mutase [Methylobacterium sp. Leaf119]WIU40279.1 histidine phosphatase family protein [Methylorubrum extorquens]
MRRALFLRHGSHDRLERILCGRMPGVSLSEAGRVEARTVAEGLARRLAGERDLRLLSSPQPRTRETAAPLAEALGVEAEIRDELDEIAFGDWTGKPFAELEGDPVWTAWNTQRGSARPPGGESMGAVQARVGGLLDRLAAEEGAPVILVSHCDPIRAALLTVLGLSLDAYDRIVVAPASCSELELWPGGGRVVSLNERLAG